MKLILNKVNRRDLKKGPRYEPSYTHTVFGAYFSKQTYNLATLLQRKSTLKGASNKCVVSK